MNKKNYVPVFIAVLVFTLLSIGCTGLIYILQKPFSNDSPQNIFAAVSDKNRIKELQVEISEDPLNSRKTITFQIPDKNLVENIKKFSSVSPSCNKCHQQGNFKGN